MFILGKSYQWDGPNPYNFTYQCVKITESFVWFHAYKNGEKTPYQHKFRKFSKNGKEYIKVNSELNLYA
jgi:hypothetical protein